MSAQSGVRSRFRRAGRVLAAAWLVAGLVQIVTATSSGAVQFCNTATITTPFFFEPGTASPYPSTITVSGLAGTITDVNITLLDLTTQGDNNSPPQHWAEDLDVLVSAPSGTGVVLMSDAGGNNDVSSGPVVNADLIFDQQAANQLPADTGPLFSGTFRPVDDDDDVADGPDQWDAPAPAPGGSSLSVFNGQSPNGTWSLWITDDVQQGTATFTGWCVDILTTGGGTTTSSTSSTSTSSTSTTSTSSTSTTSTSSTSTTSTSTTSTSTTSTTLPITCAGRTPTITGTSGPDNLLGTPGNDVIFGLGGNDRISGGGGNDMICGGDGDDVLFGGEGNDTVVGGAGNDDLAGDAGNDRIAGEGGNDRILGGAGTDACQGGSGTNQVAQCES